MFSYDTCWQALVSDYAEVRSNKYVTICKENISLKKIIAFESLRMFFPLSFSFVMTLKFTCHCNSIIGNSSSNIYLGFCQIKKRTGNTMRNGADRPENLLGTRFPGSHFFPTMGHIWSCYKKEWPFSQKQEMEGRMEWNAIIR